jgi:3-phosphoshikimate 1-carboxyvinyltransferase
VDRVIAPLSAMGATVRGEGLPLTVIGAFLRGLAYEPPVASAQVKSAVLLAG